MAGRIGPRDDFLARDDRASSSGASLSLSSSLDQFSWKSSPSSSSLISTSGERSIEEGKVNNQYPNVSQNPDLAYRSAAHDAAPNFFFQTFIISMLQLSLHKNSHLKLIS